MAAQVSVTQAIDQVEDPITQRALYALMQSVLTDLGTIVTNHNTHVHVVSGAATTTLSSGTIGNLNTIK